MGITLCRMRQIDSRGLGADCGTCGTVTAARGRLMMALVALQAAGCREEGHRVSVGYPIRTDDAEGYPVGVAPILPNGPAALGR
jgi:hypothetical protein